MTNKDLVSHQLPITTKAFDHAGGSSTTHYLNMQFASLLCQVFLHWEFLPFLPLKSTQAEGLECSKYLYCQNTEAPSGFWRSSARKCFSAARTILNLAEDAREAGCLNMNTFTLYSIFVAKFMEVYIKAFPWMDPDYVARNDLARLERNDERRLVCLPHRPYLSYCDEVEGANDVVQIAGHWADTLDSIKNYFETFKRDFTMSLTLECSNVCDSQHYGSRMNKSLRNGGDGEGCEEYEIFRHRLYDFGKL